MAGIVRLIAALVVVNLASWGLAVTLFHGSAALIGAAILAYTLGLRHALDIDHITAIDNVTRKLIRSGRNPSTSGLYFSLGHSAVVWLASIGIALAASASGPHMAFLKQAGSTIGTTISALFLLGIATANLVVLKGIAGAIRRQRRGEPVPDHDVDSLFAPKGLYTRVLRPVLRIVSSSPQMFVVGALFGLGFDTATEVGVLGISAVAAGGGLPIWSILMFPALFTAGMSLVDTLDSTLMTGAYGWAFVDPSRKLYYNFTVTFVSVVVALVVGGAEVLTLMPGGFGRTFGLLSAAGSLGYLLPVGFAGLWLAWSLLRSRRSRV